MQDEALRGLAVDIVMKAMSARAMQPDEVSQLLTGTYKALYSAANPQPEPAPQAQAPTKQKRTRKVKVDASAPIVDAEEANQQIIEDVVSDDFDEMIEENEISDEDNVVGEIKADENGEIQIPKRQKVSA